jgi:hypothetical protein
MRTLFLCIPFVVVLSCASNSQESSPDLVAQNSPPPLETSTIGEPAPRPEQEEEAEFDPLSVTVEERETTMDEMRTLIEQINQVIRARDYEGWISYLADDFISIINSPDYLAQLSATSQLLKSKNIILKSPQDYFTYVVVASRENVSVDASLDDIEFLSHTRVKAFTVNSRKQRLRLFEFVKADNTWKIAFPS